MLRRRLLAVFPLVVVAVACSDSPKPSGQSPAASPQTSDAVDGSRSSSNRTVGDSATLAPARDVCATLDYGHQRSNADYFLQFDDDSAAVEYSRGFLASNGINADAEIARDSRLIRLVSRVFDGFRQVFPHETEGMDRPPRVLVVDEEGLNAFAGYDERRDVDKAPWLFHTSPAIRAFSLYTSNLSLGTGRTKPSTYGMSVSRG